MPRPKRGMNRVAWFHFAAVAGGVLVWVLVSAASGIRVAWDSGLYYAAGMPAVCALSLILGYLAPERA